MLNIAILGRPNVGKSTLYNRLAGSRAAIAHDQPGVTRDRQEGVGHIGEETFRIIDTPGLDELGKATLAGRMSQQSMAALEHADVILFVFDARDGLSPEDEHFAQHLRKTSLPVIIIANKAESMNKVRDNIMEAWQLGFGEPVPFSAEHGEGLNNLYEALTPYFPEEQSGDDDNMPGASPAPLPEPEGGEEEDELQEHWQRPEEIHIAIVGRPNVGKSTLVNALLGEERVLTGPEAGVTRDAIHLPLRWQERGYHLVDTAGMRRKSRVHDSLEQLSVWATLNTIRYAEIAILVLDATMPLEKQDNVIAGLIEREGRGCVIALNKADQVHIDRDYLKHLYQRLDDVVPQMKQIAAVPIVATEGDGLNHLMQAVERTYEVWNTRVSTAKLNSWLHAITEHHSPPLVGGRRLKFRYITQTKARPPTFILFCNKPKDVPTHYLRYLTNNLRDAFDLPGVPLRVHLRGGKNPYV